MDKKRPRLLGLGLDEDDGHQRITRGEDVLLVGGSEETHERMQEHVIRLNEALAERGKKLSDCSVDEVRDLVRKAVDRCGE